MPRSQPIPKPNLSQHNGAWRAEIQDPRGVNHYADGKTPDDAIAVLWRSYRQLAPDLMGEIASADPFRLFPNNQTQFNPSILVQRKGIRVFDEMRRDDQVKAALTFKKHAVFAAGWRVESPEGKPDDWEPTAFIREQFDALEGTFSGMLLEIMTALDFGYSVSEKIFEEEGGRVVLRAVKTRAPHSIEFKSDAHGNLAEDGILQWQNEQGLVAMPTEKFIVFRNMREFGNPYGTSDLEAAYRGHWFKQNAYRWFGMCLERYGIPPIFAKYKSGSLNTAQIEALKGVLENIQASTVALIPFEDEPADLDFWAPELAGQVARVFEPAIAMLNTDISRAILMPGLLGLTPEQRVGSMARAKVVFDVFLFVRDFIAGEIADTAINEQLIRPLIELNFPVDEMPILRIMPIDDNLQKELFDSWVALVGADVVTKQESDEAHIRQLLKFPPRDETEEENKPDEDEEDEDDLTESTEGAAYRAFQSTVIPGRLPEGDPVERDPTDAEKRIDLPAIAADLDEIEAEFVTRLEPLADRVERNLIASVRKNGVQGSLRFIARKDITETFDALLEKSFTAGLTRAKEELPRAAAEEQRAITFLEPVEALKRLREKAFHITGVLASRILGRAREALFFSMKTGETTQAAVERLRDAVVTDFSRPRLETIVRNATIESYNLGRLNQIRQSSLVDQVMYSAIRDERTTPICLHLDGKIFNREDLALDRLLPPNHHNCRSLVIPVTPSLEVPASQLITEGQKGRAFDLGQEGFV